jgi:hypothetical protein
MLKGWRVVELVSAAPHAVGYQGQRRVRGHLRNVEVRRNPPEPRFPERGIISCRSVKQNLGITPLSSVRPTRWTRHHSSSYSSIMRMVSPSLMGSSSLRDGT